jgi:hypothetical protein
MIYPKFLFLNGIFVMERAKTPFQKFFLRQTHAGTAFQNLFFLALV